MSPDLSAFLLAGGVGAVGLFLGTGLGRWAVKLSPPPAGPPPSPRTDRTTVFLVSLATGLLFAATVFGMHTLRCQQTPEVQPDWHWRYVRIAAHLVLVALLVVASATDFRDYVIPDAVTLPGTLLALLLTTASGDLQVIHVWVDWHHEIPGLQGPEIPEWIRQHPHWHGLAYSLLGAVAGAGATMLVKGLSAVILRRDSLGLGDVTLMAMVGSYLGWQPVLVAFALAPLCGLVFGVALRLLGGKAYLPYGPWLAIASVAVMWSWRWIWMFETAWSPTSRFAVRRFFSDGVGLAIVAGVSVSAMASLLFLLRAFGRSTSR